MGGEIPKPPLKAVLRAGFEALPANFGLLEPVRFTGCAFKKGGLSLNKF